MNTNLKELRLKMADAIDDMAPKGFKKWAIDKNKEMKKRKVEKLLDDIKNKRNRKAGDRGRSGTMFNMSYQSYEDYNIESIKRKTLYIKDNLNMGAIEEKEESEIEEEDDVIEIASDDSFGDN